MGITIRGTQLTVEWDTDRGTFTINARLHPDLDGTSWSTVALTLAADGNLEHLISGLRMAALRLERPLMASWDREYIQSEAGRYAAFGRAAEPVLRALVIAPRFEPCPPDHHCIVDEARAALALLEAPQS